MTPFEIADRFVEDILAVSPMACTVYGIPGKDDQWDDLSPAGADRLADIARHHQRVLAAHLDHPDPDQQHAARVLHAYLGERLSEHEHGDHLRDLSHIYCGFTRVRDLFDIVHRDSEEAWRDITRRLDGVAEVFGQYRTTLQAGIDAGLVAARRQAQSVAGQARALAGESSMFAALIGDAAGRGFETDGLADAIASARSASAELAAWIEDRYLPEAPVDDAAGEERYLRAAESFLGLRIDPVEVYEWGWEEVRRLGAELASTAADIDPELSVEAVIELLETDPDRAAPTPEAFVDFVQARLDQAVVELEGAHFEVPDPIRRVTVSLAPAGGALGAWYINPTADWSRPGSVWYSLGDRRQVPLWQEVSTAYHEGFPGHHLQIGTSMLQADRLSRAHRLFVWYSGYGEGWALYTEGLMAELGYFEHPDYLAGMLASQLFRAVRVVVDIGCHLGLAIPADAPLHAGQGWSYERAVDYVDRIGLQDRPVAESEVSRYLGWPGQAISYKVGEREIVDIRRTLEHRMGASFDLKTFHRHVLEGGELRLDYLRRRLLDQSGGEWLSSSPAGSDRG